MSDFTVREYRQTDIPALTALWHGVFGDSEALISAFFRLLPGMGTGAVAELHGKIVGAAYAITDLTLDGKIVGAAYTITDLSLDGAAAGYIYAVAVEKSARRRGIGEAVTQKARELAAQRGAKIICTLPAEAGLYPWYERIIGTYHRLHRTFTELTCEPICAVDPLSAGEYAARREKLLAGKPHIVCGHAAMEFEEELCRTYGGGLYSVKDGICAVLRDGDTAFMHEIIADNADINTLARSAGAALGCERVRFFTVSDTGEDYISSDIPLPADCEFTFSFE